MSSAPRHNLVIVTPVYEDDEASSQLFRELAAELGRQVFVVAVDDGSVKQPVGVACISEAGLDGVLIKLKRNVGHQRAIAIGLSHVADCLGNAHRIVVMDADGEDAPGSVSRLLKTLESDEVDVAVAQRKKRAESLWFRTLYLAYKGIFQLLTGRKMDFGNFMALKAPAVRRLVAMQELWVHVAACVLTSKLRVAACPLDRGMRYAGRSKMGLSGLVLHGFKGLMVFAEDVLVRVGMACALVAALSIVGALAAVLLKLIDFATPGWFSVAMGILLLVFLQTGALTLMTLMLTGVVRGGAVTRFDYLDFVDSVTCASAAPCSLAQPEESAGG